MSNPIEERPLTDIREPFAALRLANLRAEALMGQSLAKHGQVSPIVCFPSKDGLALIDGHKRLQACLLMQWPTIQVRLLDMTDRGGKAEMIKLNRLSRTITQIEEALILHSLRNENLLTSTQIAVLSGFDKKWVSHRLALVERLHENVWHHLKRGSISANIAWLLAKLNRNNQDHCLHTILKHHLGTRDVEKLVRHLSSNPCSNILAQPWVVLDPDVPVPASSHKAWYRRLDALNHMQGLILAGSVDDTIPESRNEEVVLENAISACHDVLLLLKRSLCDDPAEPFNPAPF
ncbi:MAG: ParB/RepB/Spo0J family partition protein [Terrimicrobiaceae bacterium]